MDHPLHYCGNSFFDWSIRTHLDSSENLSRLIDEPILLTVIPQLRMVNPYGKYVTQGFSPDSSLRARGPHGPAAALKG